jgi:hypothetical protein
MHRSKVRSSADEYIAVITCARSRPETRSGFEAGWSAKACLARQTRIEPTNDLAVRSARVDADYAPAARLGEADTMVILDFSLARCAWRAARRSRERADFWWPEHGQRQ